MGDGFTSDASEAAVRGLMRQGLSDEDIARRTGLSLISLLELRAAAAVEDRSPAQQAREDGAAR